MKFDHLSLDELVEEAIRREHSLMRFYASAKESAGPDARELLTQLHKQHRERISRLENLLDEVHELRDLSVAMAD
jgi:hypothetical protein